MQTAPKTHLLSGLTTMISIQVAAFVVFHLSMALVFEIEWVKLVLLYDWLGLLNWLVKLAALYVPVAVFIWMMFYPRYSKLFFALMAVGTLYSAYYLQYPALTGFLFFLEQFARYPDFLFGNMPGIDQYPPL